MSNPPSPRSQSRLRRTRKSRHKKSQDNAHKRGSSDPVSSMGSQRYLRNGRETHRRASVPAELDLIPVPVVEDDVFELPPEKSPSLLNYVERKGHLPPPPPRHRACTVNQPPIQTPPPRSSSSPEVRSRLKRLSLFHPSKRRGSINEDPSSEERTRSASWAPLFHRSKSPDRHSSHVPKFSLFKRFGKGRRPSRSDLDEDPGTPETPDVFDWSSNSPSTDLSASDEEDDDDERPRCIICT